eukprot:757709-Hanusia_phi.AAC.2
MLPIVRLSLLRVRQSHTWSAAVQPPTELEEDEAATGSGGYGFERRVEVRAMHGHEDAAPVGDARGDAH